MPGIIDSLSISNRRAEIEHDYILTPACRLSFLINSNASSWASSSSRGRSSGLVEISFAAQP